MVNKIIFSGVQDPSILMPVTTKSFDFLQDTLTEFMAHYCLTMYGPGQSAFSPLMITSRKTGNVWSPGFWFGGGFLPFLLWFDGGDISGMANPKAVLTDFWYTSSSNINPSSNRPWYQLSAPADPVTFSDNVNRNCHLVRRCVLQDTTGYGPLGVALDLSTTLQQWVQHLTGGVSPSGAWSGSLGYRYNSVRGTVQLNGTLTITGSGSYTLPAEVRPVATRIMSVTVLDDTTYKPAICTVTTGGVVSFTGNFSGSAQIAYVDGAQYMIPN